MTEKHILLAAKLIKMRDTCRKFYGDGWKAKQDEWKPIIQSAMKKHNCDAIEAGIHMSKVIQGEGMATMVIWGTIMEMETV
jgi:hypothetical protein